MQINYSWVYYTGHILIGISVLYGAAVVLVGQEIKIEARPIGRVKPLRVAIDPEDLFADMV